MSKKFLTVLILFVIHLIIVSCTSTKPSPDEKEILSALTRIQESIESHSAFEKFGNLLSDAKKKIDAYQTLENKNECFFNAANKSYLSFEICHKAWKLKNNAQEKKKKEDMEKTMSFSQGFAAVSLAAAKECFTK